MRLSHCSYFGVSQKPLSITVYIVCGIVHNCREPSGMGVGSTIRVNVQHLTEALPLSPWILL